MEEVTKQMNDQDYVDVVQALKSKEFHRVPNDIVHAIIGVGTEAGELLDALKRAAFYGTPLDTVNLIEELGDLEWYMALLRAALHIDRQTVLQTNVAKLRKRYPNAFTTKDAEQRDLNTEREAMEHKLAMTGR